MDKPGAGRAESGFFLSDYYDTEKRIHKSREERRREVLSCEFAECKIGKQKEEVEKTDKI